MRLGVNIDFITGYRRAIFNFAAGTENVDNTQPPVPIKKVTAMNLSIIQRTLMKYTLLMWIPFILLFLLIVLNSILGRDVLSSVKGEIFGLHIIATNGTPNFTGFAGFGIISVGGLAVGLLALGGGAVGLIAVGGGAVGLVAIGGGALGVIAMGGGAAGLIAMGGGAGGYYVLAGGGWGRYVLSYQRQDPQAVHFFCKYLPALREAFEGQELNQVGDLPENAPPRM